MRTKRALRLLLLAAAATAASASGEDFLRLSGAPCTTPTYLHCPEAGCATDRVINQGPAVELETRRTYFLDYPCDLRAGEDVTLILSLHGGGSYGNWQRHYFPLLDYKEAHRLVIATPNSPIRVWTDADDRYLGNIVRSLVDQLGKAHVRAFWLVGHSQGGMTSNRLLRTEFFRDRVDGWLSLSGGRLGGNPGRAEGFGPPPSPSAVGLPSLGPGQPSLAEMLERARLLLEDLPKEPFSFVYTTGVREMDAAGLPATSKWAEQLGCRKRERRADVVDAKAGYVYDASRQDPPNPSWGLLPAPGTAQVYAYSGCRDQRVVADVVRLDKGHTEGLEPRVTEALIQLMLAAPGGKIRGL